MVLSSYVNGLFRGPEKVDIQVATALDNQPALINPEKAKQPQLNFSSNRLGIFYTFDPKNITVMLNRGSELITDEVALSPKNAPPGV